MLLTSPFSFPSGRVLPAGPEQILSAGALRNRCLPASPHCPACDRPAHDRTVSKQPTQTQAPIADTNYADFERQWTVKEKPVTNYGDEKIFTVTYSGDLSRSEFKAWWKSYDLSTIKEYAERMMAEVQSEVPGYIVTAYFSYGQYNLGSVHAESDFTGSNFDAASVWIK